jgi:hypothetical protein
VTRKVSHLTNMIRYVHLMPMPRLRSTFRPVEQPSRPASLDHAFVVSLRNLEGVRDYSDRRFQVSAVTVSLFVVSSCRRSLYR